MATLTARRPRRAPVAYDRVAQLEAQVASLTADLAARDESIRRASAVFKAAADGDLEQRVLHIRETGAMGEMLRSIIDITIVYPDGRPTLTDLLSGRVSRVRIHVQRREIPRELLEGSYENDLAVRERFQMWINGIWAEKDQMIGSM